MAYVFNPFTGTLDYTPDSVAPIDATYVTLSTNSTLTNERVLTGTASQVTVTDNGAGSTVVLSLPQNINTSATPQFGYMGIGTAAVATQGLTILLGTATDRGVVVKGASSHSGNLAEYQLNAGTIKTAVNAYGEIFFTNAGLLYLGDGAGRNISGPQNTFIGGGAGNGSSGGGSGSSNVAVGYFALNTLTTGQLNTCVGVQAGQVINSGDRNVCLGYGAGIGLTTGGSNMAIGEGALQGVTSGSNNVAVGNAGGASNWGSSVGTSVAIGYRYQITHSNTMVLTAGSAASLGLSSFESGACAIYAGSGASSATKLSITGASDTSTFRRMVDLQAAWATATDATHVTRGVFSTYYAGTAQEALRIQSASDQARVAIGGVIVSGVRQIIYAGVAAEKVLVAQGAASQTGSLQEWQESDGTARYKIGPKGAQVSVGSANNRATSNQILYGATTDAATAVELTTDGAAGSGATNRISVPTDTAMSFVLNICVKQSGSANAKQMLRQFVLSNNGGTTAVQGSVTTLGTDVGSAGLTTVTCTITANDTDDCAKVEVNGVIATNLRYTAYVVSTETLYA